MLKVVFIAAFVATTVLVAQINALGTVPVVLVPHGHLVYSHDVLVHGMSSYHDVIHTTNPLARIKFRLSAKGLEDKDVIGTSDPKVKVYSKIGSESKKLIGRTAKLDDTEDPVWPETIDFEYDPTKQPKLRFQVFDDDEGRKDDELGEATLDVNEYVQKNQDMTISLKDGKGSLTIRRA